MDCLGVGAGAAVLPPALMPLPDLFYHLRKGSLLGLILQHPDDIYVERAAFMTQGPEAARLIMPELSCLAAAGEWTPLPLVTSSLRPQEVCILDSGTRVYIWVGQDRRADIDARYEARERVASLANIRFPFPLVLEIDQGDSLARWVQCRLSFDGTLLNNTA